MEKTTSSPLFPSLGTSSLFVTSRPARVWRVTRPEPEATRATHRQETKMPTSEQDVRMVMWTAKMSTSCCGHLRLRFRLLAMEKVTVRDSRLRHPIPSPPRTSPIGSHLVVRLTAAPPAPIEPLEPPLPIPHAPSRNLHEEVQRRAQSGELNKTRRHSNCPYGNNIRNSPEQRRKTPRSSTLRNFPVIKKHDVSRIAQ